MMGVVGDTGWMRLCSGGRGYAAMLACPEHVVGVVEVRVWLSRWAWSQSDGQGKIVGVVRDMGWVWLDHGGL